MTAAKRVEHQITRQLLQRREAGGLQTELTRAGAAQVTINPWADRIISILAVTAGLFVLGSYLEELLWAAVAATTVLTLR
jgi:hypothetical protein